MNGKIEACIYCRYYKGLINYDVTRNKVECDKSDKPLEGPRMPRIQFGPMDFFKPKECPGYGKR